MKMIIGWKSIAQVTGFHVRTIKRWHYERKPIPYNKTSSEKQGKVMIEEKKLFNWLESLTDVEKINDTMTRR